MNKIVLLVLNLVLIANAFAPQVTFSRPSFTLKMAEETAGKAAPLVTGEELEMMLQEWDQPLVVDAYATW